MSSVRGFVRLPNALLDDGEISNPALRLWSLIRRRNGEREYRPCWEAAETLAARLGPSGRYLSSRFRAAQRELVARGLLVVRRRGPGQSALRWALGPGVDGELELVALRDRDQIGDALFLEVQSRRDGSVQSDGT